MSLFYINEMTEGLEILERNLNKNLDLYMSMDLIDNNMYRFNKIGKGRHFHVSVEDGSISDRIL